MPRPPFPHRRVTRGGRPAATPALVLLAALALVLGGCTGGDEEPDGGPSAAAGERTPLGDYDTAGFSLTRTSPCPALAEHAVAEALGGEVAGGSAYENGERARLAVGLRTVAQESGCVFRGEGGTTARAWAFAPPVSVPRARDVVRTLTRGRGCRRVEDAPRFGEPGVGRTCVRQQRVVGSYGGLFGDAWVGCSVAVRRSAAREGGGRQALVRRTGEWCVQVVEAARQATEEGGS